MTTNAALPKIWASGFDSRLWRGVHSELKDWTDTTYLFCGPNMLSVPHGRVKHNGAEEIISDADINPAMPVWHISLVPNVGQSKLYPVSATRMLRKLSIGNYAYFARTRTEFKIDECRGVKLLDMYIGIENSAMSFIDRFSGNTGLILRFITDSQLWKDCINDGAKFSEPVPKDVQSNNFVQYNPFIVPRGVNPYNTLTIGDIAWAYLGRCAQASCEYAISETRTKGFQIASPLHYISSGVYERIEHPLLMLRARKFRELLDFIHTQQAETQSYYYKISLSFLKELGIYPNV